MYRVKLVFYQLELHLGKSNLWTWQVGHLKFKRAFLSYEKVIAGYDKKKNKKKNNYHGPQTSFTPPPVDRILRKHKVTATL